MKSSSCLVRLLKSPVTNTFPRVALCPPDDDINCPVYADTGDCLHVDRLEHMHCRCPKSCETFSACNNSLGDTDCKCANLAYEGKCDTDPDVQSTCAYTCALRRSKVSVQNLSS
ncbi:uncharacterized protein LOC121387820 isoform X1 [Gigantopelta aegis]|uniref:uncharacterized protein LOC121387820 isoform X1 n=1 Tax=Gigantopelta aegis TaxID=1735272 RepID=UPI001B88BCD1|nr:uncharacterized protein LOC121387820 isoform X1 [Gigantopelta aegis]